MLPSGKNGYEKRKNSGFQRFVNDESSIINSHFGCEVSSVLIPPVFHAKQPEDLVSVTVDHIAGRSISWYRIRYEIINSDDQRNNEDASKQNTNEGLILKVRNQQPGNYRSKYGSNWATGN